MKKFTFLFALFALLLYSSAIKAVTYVNKDITADETWTLAGSPYTIVANVILKSGVTLNIDPGVRIEFLNNSTFTVSGEMKNPAKPALPVYFKNGKLNFSSGNTLVASNIEVEGTQIGIGRVSDYIPLDFTLSDSKISTSSISLLFNFMAPTNPPLNSDVTIKVQNTSFFNCNGIFLAGAYLAAAKSIIFEKCSLKKSNIILSAQTITIKESNADSIETIKSTGGLFVYQQTNIYSSTINNSNFTGKNYFSKSKILNLDYENASNKNNNLLDYKFDSCSVKLTNNSVDKKLLPINGLSFNNTSFISNVNCNGNNFNRISIGDQTEIKNCTFINTQLFYKEKNQKTISGNNFLFSAKYAAYLDAGNDINLKDNFWGNTTSTEIADLIYDGNDSPWISVGFPRGKIDFSNYLTTPNTSAPISPPQNLNYTNDVNGLKISWDTNPETDVKGYKIYYGSTDGINYTKVIDVGNVNNYVVPGLTENDLFAVTAYDNDADGTTDLVEGHESWFGERKFEKPKILGDNFTAFCVGKPVKLKSNPLTLKATYQWYYNSGLPNAPLFPAANGANSSIIVDGTLNDYGKYHFVVTINGCKDSSNVVTVATYSASITPASNFITCGNSTVNPNQANIIYPIMVPALTSSHLKYNWTPSTSVSNPNILNPTFSPKTTTTYTLELSLGSCSDKGTFEVIVNPIKINVVKNKSLICGGDLKIGGITTDYNGVGTLKYQWNPVIGLDNANIENPTANITTNQSYTVTIDDGNGCSSQETVFVGVTPLTINTGTSQSIICGGSAQFSQTQTNYNGSGILSYQWTPNTGLDKDNIANPTATITSDETYTVKVKTDNGCEATNTLQVKVNPLTINTGASQSLICGGSAQFSQTQTNYTGSGILSYLWTPNTGLDKDNIANPTATITSDETYTVKVKTDNGCEATNTLIVKVNPLTLNAGSDIVSVCGTALKFNQVSSNYNGVKPLTYSWLPVTGLDDASINNPTANPKGAQTYTLTIKTDNGCSAQDNINVSFNAMAATDICIVSVDDNNHNKIAWIKPSSTSIDSFYIYRESNVTNIYEKIGSVSYNDLSVFIDNQSNSSIQSNKYKVSIMDACRMESTQSNPHKTMHLSINQGTNGNTWNLNWEPYEGFTVSTYKIYRGTDPLNMQLIGSTAGSSNQYSDFTAPTGYVYYQVEIVSPNTCSAEGSRSNKASNNPNAIKDQAISSNNFTVYPNPVKDVLKINSGKNLSSYTVELFDLDGKLLLRKACNGIDAEVNLSEIATGIYFLKLITIEGSQVKKIVKN